jgi:RNA polymerase sigma factor (sigma-70 family)
LLGFCFRHAKKMILTSERKSDEQLWFSLKAGDPKAFAALYSRYFQVLFSYGRRISDQGEDVVGDAIQDLFIVLWRTRSGLGEAENVRFYLFRSLRRKIHRIVKKDLQQDARLDDLTDDLIPVEASVEIHFTNNEDLLIQSEKLASWLGLLPPRQNEALILHYFHDMTYPQIATILDIKEQTARNLVQKALTMIRSKVG